MVHFPVKGVGRDDRDSCDPKVDRDLTEVQWRSAAFQSFAVVGLAQDNKIPNRQCQTSAVAVSRPGSAIMPVSSSGRPPSCGFATFRRNSKNREFCFSRIAIAPVREIAGLHQAAIFESRAFMFLKIDRGGRNTDTGESGERASGEKCGYDRSRTTSRLPRVSVRSTLAEIYAHAQTH